MAVARVHGSRGSERGAENMSGTRKPAEKPNQSAASAKPSASRRLKASASLTQAPADKCFWVNHGPVLKDLRELRDALVSGISEEQFAFHAGAGKNDFATWVDHVLGDAKCAVSLRRARTRAAAARAVERALARASG